MRIVSLNAWGGRSLHPLVNFFMEQADTTDVFCLQEIFDADQKELDERHPESHIRGDVFKIIQAVLKDFDGFFAAYEDNPARMSQAMFVRRSIGAYKVSDEVIYTPAQAHEVGLKIFSPRKLQYATIARDNKEYLVMNYHGLWDAGPKIDTPDRLKQSEVIKDFLSKHHGPKIICGDFNLLPDTESIKMLEEGMKNLVKEHGVASTRTVLYRHYDNPAEPNFADYILVSPDIEVTKFHVLPHIVSDHSPLKVEF